MSGCRAKLIALCSLAVGLASFANGALACACNFSRAQAMRMADVVFVGRVLQTRRAGDDIHASIGLVRSAKGAAPRRMDVHTSALPVMCGWTFETGQTLDVAVFRRGAKYSTNSCLMGALNPRR